MPAHPSSLGTSITFTRTKSSETQKPSTLRDLTLQLPPPCLWDSQEGTLHLSLLKSWAHVGVFSFGLTGGRGAVLTSSRLPGPQRMPSLWKLPAPHKHCLCPSGGVDSDPLRTLLGTASGPSGRPGRSPWHPAGH